MKESIYHNEQTSVVLHIPMIDEQTTRKHGGTPTYMDFDHGIGRFSMDYNPNFGMITYDKYLSGDLALMKDISVEMKIKPDNYGLGCGNTCKLVYNGRFAVGLYGGVNKYVWCTSDELSYTNSAADSIALDEWVHIVCTRKTDGTTNFYINGVLNGTANQDSGTPVLAIQDLTINDDAFCFIGSIDYVEIWNKLLTAEEAWNLSH